jgi:hypothetical protein
VGAGAARPPRAAGEARHAHRISKIDEMIVGGSTLNVMKGTFMASPVSRQRLSRRHIPLGRTLRARPRAAGEAHRACWTSRIAGPT